MFITKNDIFKSMVTHDNSYKSFKQFNPHHEEDLGKAYATLKESIIEEEKKLLVKNKINIISTAILSTALLGVGSYNINNTYHLKENNQLFFSQQENIEKNIQLQQDSLSSLNLLEYTFYVEEKNIQEQVDIYSIDNIFINNIQDKQQQLEMHIATNRELLEQFKEKKLFKDYELSSIAIKFFFSMGLLSIGAGVSSYSNRRNIIDSTKSTLKKLNTLYSQKKDALPTQDILKKEPLTS